MASNGGAANGAAGDPVEEAKALVAELCAGLYGQGHVSGTGGGISIKVPTPAGDRIVMAPSGVQKERMRAQDMYVLDGASGAVLHTPEARPPPYKAPKLSECAPLFMSVRGCGRAAWESGPAVWSQSVHLRERFPAAGGIWGGAGSRAQRCRLQQPMLHHAGRPRAGV